MRIALLSDIHGNLVRSMPCWTTCGNKAPSIRSSSRAICLVGAVAGAGGGSGARGRDGGFQGNTDAFFRHRAGADAVRQGRRPVRRPSRVDDRAMGPAGSISWRTCHFLAVSRLIPATNCWSSTPIRSIWNVRFRRTWRRKIWMSCSWAKAARSQSGRRWPSATCTHPILDAGVGGCLSMSPAPGCRWTAISVRPTPS